MNYGTMCILVCMHPHTCGQTVQTTSNVSFCISACIYSSTTLHITLYTSQYDRAIRFVCIPIRHWVMPCFWRRFEDPLPYFDLYPTADMLVSSDSRVRVTSANGALGRNCRIQICPIKYVKPCCIARLMLLPRVALLARSMFIISTLYVGSTLSEVLAASAVNSTSAIVLHVHKLLLFTTYWLLHTTYYLFPLVVRYLKCVPFLHDGYCL